LRLWHSVGTGLYVLQWLCAGITFKRLIGWPIDQSDSGIIG
jgi:hypothetical protein